MRRAEYGMRHKQKLLVKSIDGYHAASINDRYFKYFG